MTIRVAALDVDGVLINSHTQAIAVVNRALRQCGGHEITIGWYRNHELTTHEEFLRSRGVPPEHFEYCNEVLNQAWLEIAHSHTEREGASEVLEYCAVCRIPAYALSACGQELTEVKLRPHKPIFKYLEGIYGEENKEQGIRNIATQRGVEPTEILFISDMGRDLEHARKAGIVHAIGIVSPFSTRPQLEQYGYPVVENHRETLELLEQILGSE